MELIAFLSVVFALLPSPVQAHGTHPHNQSEIAILAKEICKVGDYVTTNLADYPIRSSLLHIFVWMRAPCSGVVQSVTFMNYAAISYKKNFYLASFEAIVNRPDSFRMLNYVNISIPGGRTGWQTERVPRITTSNAPFRVKQGDYFGYFYDFDNLYWPETVIPLLANRSHHLYDYTTYIGQIALHDFADVQELRSNYELFPHSVSRIPAMRVQIIKDLVPLGTTTFVIPILGPPPPPSPIYCLSPPIFLNGRVLVNPAKTTVWPVVGDVLTIECLYGYTHYDNNIKTIRCLSDLSWTYPRPRCVRAANCGTPPAIANAVVASQTFSEPVARDGDSVLYKCAFGFTAPSGTQMRIQCRIDKWTTLPTCVPPCGALPAFPNLRVTYRSFSANYSFHGDFFQVQCNPGYMQLKPAVYCVNGNWQPDDPCVVTCGAPPIVNHGLIDIISFTGKASVTGSLVSYICLPGYELMLINNNNTVYCGANGNWSNNVPWCRPLPSAPGSVYCGIPPSFRNARLVNVSFPGLQSTNGSRAYYECNTGYIRVAGSPYILCQANRSWAHNGPVCRSPQTPPPCGPPPALPNAQAIDIHISGDDTGANAVEGDFIRYECLAGFFRNGTESTTVCNRSLWTPVSPCVPMEPVGTTPINCGVVRPLSNGFVVKIDYINGVQIAFYDCNADFKFISNGDVTCQGNGQWSRNLPVCEIKAPPLTFRTCGAPIPIANAWLVEQSFQGTDSREGDQAMYVCDDGMGTNNAITTCSDSQWVLTKPCIPPTPTPPTPQPIRAMCGAVPHLQNGKVVIDIEFTPDMSANAVVDIVTPNTSDVGMAYEFRCLPGFTFLDPNLKSIVCMENGTWSQMPTCVIAAGCPCSKLCEIENGEITDVGDYYSPNLTSKVGVVITYECNQPYGLANDHTGQVRCLEQEVWSDLPECIVLYEEYVVYYYSLAQASLPSWLALVMSLLFNAMMILLC